MDTIIEILNDDRNVSEILFEPQNGVFIRPSKISGRGVFADKNYVKGDVIETFPVIPLAFRLRYVGDPVLISNSFINTLCACEDFKAHGYQLYLGGGCSIFYNHQRKHNAELHMNWSKYYGEFRASSVIKKETEITIDYGRNYPWDMLGVSPVELEGDD